MLKQILQSYESVMLFYVGIGCVINIIILGFSIMDVFKILSRRKYSDYDILSGSQYLYPISILVPAYNEELTIKESVKSLLLLNYPEYEVLVVNDGSKDKTLKVLIDEFNLRKVQNVAVRDLIEATKDITVYHNNFYPNLFVIDKSNGGKSDSLNVATNLSKYPLVASIDADSLLEKDALTKIAAIYMEKPEETIAVGGNIRVVNDCVISNGHVKKVCLPKGMLPMFQLVEYIKAFIGGRIGWSHINSLAIVSGAFGVFKKEYVVKVGGYTGGYPGEDMNVIVKLHKYMIERKKDYRIVFCPEAVCWTQAPDNFGILTAQRKRWGRGNVKNMWKHKKTIFNPKYKFFGILSMFYSAVFEMATPYIRVSGYAAMAGFIYMGMANWQNILILGGVNIAIGLLTGTCALMMDELLFKQYKTIRQTLKMQLYLLMMCFGYYQIDPIWRFLGHIDFLRNKNAWGNMARVSWKGDKVTNTAVQ